MEILRFVLIFILLEIPQIIGWIIVRFLTTHKYFWCKKRCRECGCWSCKFYPESEVTYDSKE